MSGKRTSLKDPDLSENLYVYDDAGRLSKMQVAASRTAYFAYDASGMVVRRHAPLNEVVAYFTYDSAARLRQLENRAVTGALLSYFAYQRNALGAQTWIRHEGAEDTYFEYDPLDRLTREFRTPTGTARSHDDYYAYDAVGNRVLKVDRTASQNVYYMFDARNLMAKEWNKDAPETTYFAYDAARRMTSLKLPGGQSSYFTHDQRDQVKKVEFAKASSPDSTQEFGYTGQGERVSIKIGNGSTTDLRLAYDGQKLLTEKNAASGSATVRRYRHNRSLVDCMGSAIEWDFGGTRRYGAFNGQGTLVGLIQDFGGGEIISDSIVRDAFGKLVTRGTVLGTDQGKLQFLASGLLDLQLSNVQLGLGAGGGCYLPKEASPLGGETQAGEKPTCSGDTTSRAAASFLVLVYILHRTGGVLLCQNPEEDPWKVYGEMIDDPRCGPDVTAQVLSTLDDIARKFRGEPAESKKDMCNALYDVVTPHAKGSMLAAWAWDIPLLFKYNDWTNWNNGACAQRGTDCEGTVEFMGGCYNSAVVNYLMWGVMRWLCAESVPGHSVTVAGALTTPGWILMRNIAMDKPDDNRFGEGSQDTDQRHMAKIGQSFTEGGMTPEATSTLREEIDAVQKHRTRPERLCSTTCGKRNVPPGPWPFVWEPRFQRDPSGPKYTPRRMTLKDYYDQWKKYGK